MRFLFLIVLVFSLEPALGQAKDPDLLRVKDRLDSISAFSVDLSLSLDIDFINMPPKQAQMYYSKKKGTRFSSDDFVIIPKRGLDFSMTQLFEYDFLTVSRGYTTVNGIPCHSVAIIPNDKRADFAIATLHIDTVLFRVVVSEISTKKDGTFNLDFSYASEPDVMPSLVVVNFEIEEIKLPLSFMSKQAEIDKEKMKEDGVKSGQIRLTMTNYKIQKKE